MTRAVRRVSASRAGQATRAAIRSGWGSASSAPVGRIAAQAAVLTAVVVGTVAYTHSGSSYLLTVDGRTREVSADAATVRRLLAEQSVAVSDRDLVSPGLDTVLADGQQVVVRYARPLTVDVDGVPRTYWTTELTLDSALAALGIRADRAQLSVSRSQPLGRAGLALSVSTAASVTVTADGETHTVSPHAATVQDLLTERRLVLGPLDTVSAAVQAPIVNGMALAVTRIEKTTQSQLENIPPPVTEQRVATLAVGERKVIREGEPGRRAAVYSVVLADGKVASRTLRSATVKVEPVASVVQVGTKRAPEEEPDTTPSPTPTADGDVATVIGMSGADGTTGFDPSKVPALPEDDDEPSSPAPKRTRADSLNWAALARCESGGNLRAVNPAGYYGRYQFSLSTWRRVGGTGNPIDASAQEQLLRAKILYNRAGAGQWGCGRHLFD